MDKVRRSKRTPKSKAEVKVKISKTKSADKSVVQIAANASTKEERSICKKQRTKTLGTFVIDCDDITGENKFDIDALKVHLQRKIKVEGKWNDPRVKVEKQDMKILIRADVFIEKTYIKYLIKLFLKSKKLNNCIRIVNGKRSYTLKSKDNF